MISLICPFWQRQAAADAALSLLAKQYAYLDLEVIVVDDGDPVPFVPPAFRQFVGIDHDGIPAFKHSGGLPVRVVRLPQKSGAMCACVPINRGVAISTGDFIALSSVEMLHIMPVLAEMREEIRRGGELTYVSAAVWAPESKTWHAHSSLKRPPLNFMTMLHRELWDRTGGFDEDYRDGIAFEDADFVKRLERAGARFVIRDDLVIHHPRKGAKAKYTPEQHERNRLLFARKWG